MNGRCGSWRSVLAPALHALRVYWPVFLALQGCAALLVLGYYTSGSVREAAYWILGWKKSGGLVFVAVAGVLSGAVLPEVFKALLRPPGYRRLDAAGWLHLCTLMALLGVAVNFFYRLQGWWFGGLQGVTALALKIFVDQFCYSLFIALPIVLVWFEWKANHYDIKPVLALLRPRVFWPRLMRLFIPNLMFWAPSLVALYALPGELQFLLFVFINAAWCLVMVLIAREVSAEDVAADHPAGGGVSSNGTTGASRQSDSKS